MRELHTHTTHKILSLAPFKKKRERSAQWQITWMMTFLIRLFLSLAIIKRKEERREKKRR